MKKKSKIAGLSLIEILIGIVISSIMIAAMYTTYTVVNNSYSQVTDIAQISRSGRDVVAMLMRDVRMAGFKYFYGYNRRNEERGEDKIPREDYLEFIAGDTEGTCDDDATERKFHVPIVICKNKIGYPGISTTDIEGSKYEAIPDSNSQHATPPGGPGTIDPCCDRIHIVYGDFDVLDFDQPYKRYRITYYAKPMIKKIGSSKKERYYGLYRSLESWIQTVDDDEGDWAEEGNTRCTECYNEELLAEYLVDMEFFALGRNGMPIAVTTDNEQFGRADPVLDKDTIFDIRSVDIRLTFRSSAAKGFYRTEEAGFSEDTDVDTGDTITTRIPRILYSFGARTIPFFDKHLRDSVVVTVHTRNIGEMY